MRLRSRAERQFTKQEAKIDRTFWLISGPSIEQSGRGQARRAPADLRVRICMEAGARYACPLPDLFWRDCRMVLFFFVVAARQVLPARRVVHAAQFFNATVVERAFHDFVAEQSKHSPAQE